MPELAFSPLENGLDYLQSVVDGLAGDPTKRDLKYAVLHLSAGIEVLAKYRLHREHWTLVSASPTIPRSTSPRSNAETSRASAARPP
jgi:hypothetical protein